MHYPMLTATSADPRRISSFSAMRSLVVWFLLAGGLPATVIDDLLTKVQQSEFVFPRTDSNAPFVPLAWVNATFYSDSQVKLTDRTLGFTVWSESEALISPVWVGKKDMILAGEYVSLQQVRFNQPTSSRLSITTLIPVLAWARQFTPQTQGGVFVAPNFVNGGEYNGYRLRQTSVYAGAVALHWNSDRFAWAGGLIGYGEDGDVLWLPYVGAIWRLSNKFSLGLVLPWPAMTYAPTPRYMFQFGLSPAGATLGGSRDGQQLHVGFASWNLLFSAHHQLTKSLWLSAGAGWSGFGSFTITSAGATELKQHLDRGPVFSVQLALRPPTSLAH
jgi:hypothetical protein